MIIVTRNASDRLRGFLASVALEVDAGIYVTTSASPALADRIWDVIDGWTSIDGSAILVLPDKHSPGGLRIRTLGLPHFNLVEVDGLFLSSK